jgi:multicomponent Na+:H+ antiporter subunit F
MSDLAFRIGALVLVALVLVYVHRVATGPTVFDRILGVSAFGTKTTLLLPMLGVLFERLDLFVDLSLAYALLNFVGSLAAARYFESVGPR